MVACLRGTQGSKDIDFKKKLNSSKLFNCRILAVIFLMPIVGCLSLHFGIGQRLTGLTLGLVNDEASIKECLFCPEKKFTTDWFGCKLNKLSCRFIEDFDQNTAKLVNLIKLPKNSKFYLFSTEILRNLRRSLS